MSKVLIKEYYRGSTEEGPLVGIYVYVDDRLVFYSRAPIEGVELAVLAKALGAEARIVEELVQEGER